MDKWAVAMGNLEDARVVLDTLAQAVEDAVYLDEDAYNQLLPTMQYTRVVQAQQRQLAELEAENARLRNELHEAQGGRAQVEASVAELRQELENNAVVFKMHYNELLTKEDEIMRLKAVVEALSK